MPDSKQLSAKQFGRYILDERIAMGGMAEIFRAHINKEGFEKEVCIKRVLPHYLESEDFVTMFRDEASVAARLQHANVVQVFDFGEVDGALFLAMELVDGADLNSLLKKARQKKSPFKVGQAVQIAIDVCRGLYHAHSASFKGKPLNVVHRDISPHNILVSHDGEVKVTDFGIAKAAERATHTSTGVVKGKLAYMAPEQLEGVNIDHRLDQFSTALVLWEMLTLEKAFSGDSEATLLRQVMVCDIPPPRAFRQGIPKSLEDILMKALEADREQRYENMRAFERALTKFLYSHSDDPAESDVQALFAQLMSKNKRPPTVLLPKTGLQAEKALPEKVQKNTSEEKLQQSSTQEDLVALDIAHAMKTMVSGTSSDVFSKPKTPVVKNRIETGENPEDAAKTALLDGESGRNLQVELSKPFRASSEDATRLLGDEGVSDVFENKVGSENSSTELVPEREAAPDVLATKVEHKTRLFAALSVVAILLGVGAFVFLSFSSGSQEKTLVVEKKNDSTESNFARTENNVVDVEKESPKQGSEDLALKAGENAAQTEAQRALKKNATESASESAAETKAVSREVSAKPVARAENRKNKKKKWSRKKSNGQSKAKQNKAKKGRGIVFIDVEGTWAEISEKGKSLGQTPYQASVSAGKHQFVLYNPATKKRKTVIIHVKKGGKHTRFLPRL